MNKPKRNSAKRNSAKRVSLPKYIVPQLDINNSDEDFEIEVIEPSVPNDEMETNTSPILKYVNMDTSTSIKWSRMDEKTVNKYILKAIGYKSLYNDTYFMYMFYYNLIKIPLVIFTAISIAIQIIFATIIQNDSTVCNNTGNTTNIASILSITIAAVSATVAVLTYFHSSTGYGTYAHGSRDAAIAFSEFADDLKTLLNFPRHIRENPYVVINSIQNDYKKLLKTYSKYPIPMSVFHNFAKKSKNKSIISDIVDNTDADQFDLHDGTLERNIITEKFIESIRNIRNNTPVPLPTERYSKRNTTEAPVTEIIVDT